MTGPNLSFFSSPIFITFIVPLLCFFIGVAVSDVIKLHSIARRNLYAMAIPVGVFMTGFMISSAKVTIPAATQLDQTATITTYGFVQEIDQYMMFAGILMFIGVSVPSIFNELRDKFGNTKGVKPSKNAVAEPASG